MTPAEPAAAQTGTEEKAPAALPRRREVRASAARKALLAAAQERTGDAPGTAVAVLEPAPAPELTWYPTDYDVVAAKFRRWRAAMPAPIPPTQAPCLSDAEMAEIMGRARPPLPDEAAYAESLAVTKSRHASALSNIDSRNATLLTRIDARNTQVRQEIGAACGRQPAEPPPPVTAPEQHHDTGPHPWLDTMALELAPDTDAMTLDPDYDGCADGETSTDPAA